MIELEFLMIFAISVFKMGRDVVWFDFMGALCFAGATCRSEVLKSIVKKQEKDIRLLEDKVKKLESALEVDQHGQRELEDDEEES